MPMRSSSLANNPLAITREMDGRYDVVLQVRDNLDLIEQVAGVDFAAILAELESAQDFTGITVVQGETVAWDAVNKILTVPKGDKGDKGDTGDTGLTGPQGIQGPQGIKGDAGLKGDTGSQGPKGFDGAAGAQGLKGDTGDDLTITQITYNGNGTFNWLFSDGTTYVTPDLRGPKGDTGDQGIKGDQGISVHHLKGTSTTNPNGDFGTSPFRDTYTFYGDADETLNLGWFVVTNGAGMSATIYDTNKNGVVDNSERLDGELPGYYVNVSTNQTVSGNKTFTDNVIVQGDLTVSGNVVSVDVETVTVKDNLIVLNSGEVGAGVTAGEAGIIVDRGTELDYKFVFDEVSDSFKVGQEGSLQKVATREDSPINGGVAIWDTVDNRFEATKNVAIDTISIGGHTVSWNTDESTLDVALGAATLQVGQEQLIRVTNNSGISIDNGMAVMATGTLGNSGRITVARANLTQANAKFILGVVTETIANGADGFVTAFGKVRGIQTNGVNHGETWVDGDVLYVKDSGSGALTKVVPTDTQVKLPVAIVISAHGSNGTLFVRVNSIDENHAKVELATKVNKNANIVAGTATKVTYDAKGLVTSGTNPTTLSGYGITDADTSAQVTTKINNAVAALVDASPTTLDTLNELAAALGDDPNFATTTSTALGNRVVKNADIVAGTGTKITYDAKGLVTSSTTPTTLAGYSIGDAYTKAEADALHDSLAVASAGQSVSYFLDNVIKPGGNYALTNSPDGDPETTIAKIAVAANTPYFMERYISDPIGGTTIDGGLWVFRTYARVSSDIGTSEIISRINKRTIKSGTVTITGTGTSRTITSSDPIFVLEDANSSVLNATLIETPTETFWISAFTSATQVTVITDNSGYINETSVSIHMYYKLFEATTGDINGNTAKLYETKSIQPSFNIVPTDSILIAYFAITTSTNKTLTLYKGGTVNYSHIVTPIVYRHNSLKGLNEGEFQHLTAAQLAKINATIRADKYLAAQNIANMSYTDGNLTRIQYNDALDIDYEVFAYTSGNLSSIQHYVGSVLKGTTTLSYTSGNLVSAIFVGV